MARTRSEIIASLPFAPVAAPPVPPARAPRPAPPAGDEQDRSVVALLRKAIALQEADPDAATDENDQQLLVVLKQALAAEEADARGEQPEKPPATKPPAAKPATGVSAASPAVPAPVKGVPPAAPTNKPTGSMANGAICANGDCGHMAVSHANSGEGENRGACGLCDCPEFKVATEGEGGSEEGAPAKQAHALAVPGAVEAPEAVADGEPPPMVVGEEVGEPFTIPVAIIEGKPASDGREIAVGALSWREPPLPLMLLDTSSHDPAGLSPNAPAVLAGRIDSLEREDNGDGTASISARGFCLSTPDGERLAELCRQMGRMGVSADVAAEESEIGGVGDEASIEDLFDMQLREQLTKGTIMALTVCPMPAFEGAYIVLGDGAQQPEPIPQAAEPVTAGAMPVHWMTFDECAPCAEGLEVVVAAGGPVRPPAAWFADPGFKLGDGRLQEILSGRGERQGRFACPITVDEHGRVFGHIAPWGVCHTSFGGECVVAPRSACNYAHFRRGQHVVTAEGERVPVGVITCDAGHAASHDSPAVAMAHYDNTAVAAADVNIGEDEFGIWVAGAIRPDATDEQVRKLRAASISGDWRSLGGQLELVAALAVNNPGFPMAVVAGGRPVSLVAAGGGVMAALKREHAPHVEDPALRAALTPLLDEVRSRSRTRVEKLLANH